MLNWNGKAYALKCVESVLRSDYQNYKIVLIDNGSSDNSLDCFEDRYGDNPKVLLLDNKSNMGYAGGNNEGVTRAIKDDAEYVFILNNDTVIEEQTLSRLVDTAISDPCCGMIGPKVLFMDDKTRLCSSFDRINLWFFGILPTTAGRLDQGQYDNVKEVDSLVGCAMLIPCHVIKKAGMFDADYFAYYEEVDLSYRIRQAGYSIRFTPRAIVYHKGGASTSESDSALVSYLKVRNMILFMRKNAKYYHYITFIPIAVVVVSQRLLVRLVKLDIDGFKAILSGVWWHFKSCIR